MDGTVRSNIKPGMRVQIVQKQDQRSGKLTDGIVKRLLTNSANHPRGIKVCWRMEQLEGYRIFVNKFSL